MSWKDRMKEWGSGDLTFLSSDGECLVFVIVDEPVLLIGKYKGKEQQRIGCPIVTDEGFMLFITGKRLARKLSKFEDRFKDSAFMVVRHGESGDIECKYDVSIMTDKAKKEQLFLIAKKEYKPAMLKQAVEDAKEVMAS